jgi:hypothetical protein
MRELWRSGWMHNRVRMVVASFLTKNLRLPWHEGARWFWDTLVDADLAANTLGWQWTAGCERAFFGNCRHAAIRMGSDPQSDFLYFTRRYDANHHIKSSGTL